jgi:hypothetical protein
MIRGQIAHRSCQFLQDEEDGSGREYLHGLTTDGDIFATDHGPMGGALTE